MHRACAGYQLWRREWQFWRWQSPRARLNHYVRLFDRQCARMSGHEVHEAVQVDGPVGVLDVVIDHYGEPDIAGRVAKANRYSTLQLADLATRKMAGCGCAWWLYPTVAFLRYYLLRGHWRSGWAGFIAARIHAFYAFLKYAKLYEARVRARQGAPAASAPALAVDRGSPGGRVLKRLCTHRYCAGASRTIRSMQALTRAVSASDVGAREIRPAARRGGSRSRRPGSRRWKNGITTAPDSRAR